MAPVPARGGVPAPRPLYAGQPRTHEAEDLNKLSQAVFELETWNFQRDLHKVQTPFVVVAVVVHFHSFHYVTLPKRFSFQRLCLSWKRGIFSAISTRYKRLYLLLLLIASVPIMICSSQNALFFNYYCYYCDSDWVFGSPELSVKHFFF